jgi:hypothetical protein
MLPPRREVRNRLVRLLGGLDAPETVADWATEQVALDESNDEIDSPGWDKSVWKALGQLEGADLKISDTDYLHGEKDFRSWLDEFDRSEPSGP